ncbi:MAG: RNA polymerase sigma factor [Polyangiaceae bacterium]|jgi:RNA polymerase sigma-70 factor, ECF subfamily
MVRETSDRSELPLSLVRANEDRSLVERCIASDRAAQRELFRRESRRVHATLFRILGGNLSMDDLIQDVFIEVFKSLPSFRGEASLSTWIDRCTVHIAISYLRKKRPKLVEMVVETQSGGSSPEEHMLLKEAARRLYAELDRMDPTLRLAITLHVIDDRPVAEVAEIMEASVVATKTRVWRARRHLEKCAQRDPALAAFLSHVPVSSGSSGGGE